MNKSPSIQTCVDNPLTKLRGLDTVLEGPNATPRLIPVTVTAQFSNSLL